MERIVSWENEGIESTEVEVFGVTIETRAPL